MKEFVLPVTEEKCCKYSFTHFCFFPQVSSLTTGFHASHFLSFIFIATVKNNTIIHFLLVNPLTTSSHIFLLSYCSPCFNPPFRTKLTYLFHKRVFESKANFQPTGNWRDACSSKIDTSIQINAYDVLLHVVCGRNQQCPQLVLHTRPTMPDLRTKDRWSLC